MKGNRAAQIRNFIIDEQGEGGCVAGAVPRDGDNLSQESRLLAGDGRLLLRINGLRDNLPAGVDDGIDLDKSICREVAEARYAVPFKNRAAVDQNSQRLPRAVAAGPEGNFP